jgi:uncharacterized membrane protein
MESERGIERLIFFTDAVVAIAITLLILPLVEIVTTDANKAPQPPLSDFLTDNLGQFFAFALSFVIIARFWMANHEILLNTKRATPILMWLDIAWVFTIVVLPLPTELTAVYPASQLNVTIYIGTAFSSTLLLTAMSVYLYFNPRLERKGKEVSTTQVWGIGSTAAAFLVALALELVFPKIHYYSLFALLLTFPLDLLVKPRLRQRETARRAKRSTPSTSHGQTDL